MPVKMKLDKKLAAWLVADFIYPTEQKSRSIGLAMAGAAYLVILLIALVVGRKAEPSFLVPGVALAWIVFACVYFGPMAEAKEESQLASIKGQKDPAATPEAPVGGSDDAAAVPAGLTLPDIVNRQSRVLGIKPLGVKLVEGAPGVAVIGRTLVVAVALRQHLTPAEMWSVIAGELGRFKAGDTKLTNFCRRVESAPAAVRHTLGLPATILCACLAPSLVEASFTADRMALLLTRDRRICSSAIIKLALQARSGEAASVSSAEVSEYLGRRVDIEAKQEELTTHFKLGQFLRDQPALMARVTGLREYSESAEFEEALEKLGRVSAEATERMAARKQL